MLKINSKLNHPIHQFISVRSCCKQGLTSPDLNVNWVGQGSSSTPQSFSRVYFHSNFQAANHNLKQEVDILKKELDKRDVVIEKLEKECVSSPKFHYSTAVESLKRFLPNRVLLRNFENEAREACAQTGSPSSTTPKIRGRSRQSQSCTG